MQNDQPTASQHKRHSRLLAAASAAVIVVVGLGAFALAPDKQSNQPVPHSTQVFAANTAKQRIQPPRMLENGAPFSFADDSAGLLLTWVDEQGDFHVTQKPADVPATARHTVRVVLQSQPAGSPDTVFVTNLDQKGSDGRYPVRTMPRSAWDELGAARRKERMDRLAPPAAASATPNGPLAAVIYGADWCKPCHQAADWLKARGVPAIVKDIDKSPEAEAEMVAKLQKAGMRRGSIPVIDVAGKILVGYSERQLAQALSSAKSGTML